MGRRFVPMNGGHRITLGMAAEARRQMALINQCNRRINKF